MKRLTVVAFALCLAMAPFKSLGADTVANTGKDLCMLYSQDCRAMSYQEKIARFNEEIGKGTQVYTPAEVQRLQNKLKETEQLYWELVYSPSNHGHR
jgi:hypothetical protein